MATARDGPYLGSGGRVTSVIVADVRRHLMPLLLMSLLVALVPAVPAQAATVPPCGALDTPAGRLCALLYADVATFSAPGITRTTMSGQSGTWTRDSRGFHTSNDTVSSPRASFTGTVGGLSGVKAVADGFRASTRRAGALGSFMVDYTRNGQHRHQFFLYNWDVTFGGSQNFGELEIQDFACPVSSSCQPASSSCWSGTPAINATSTGQTVRVIIPIKVTRGTGSSCSGAVGNGRLTIQATFATTGTTRWQSVWDFAGRRTILTGTLAVSSDNTQLLLAAG